MILTGVGAGLVIPAVSGSVMSSLPREHSGVGSATNGVSIQVGSALGVAIIGSFAYAARVAFLSGADLGLLVAAVVVLAGCALALGTVPTGRRGGFR